MPCRPCLASARLRPSRLKSIPNSPKARAQKVTKQALTENAKQYHEKLFPRKASTLAETDPELIDLFDNFAFDEVVGQDDLDDHTRMLATLLGCQYERGVST